MFARKPGCLTPTDSSSRTLSSRRMCRSGYNEIRNLCKQIGIELITTTGMRHRASTAFWSMDVSEEDIDCFMEHVGHHRNIDKNIYACPPAMRVMQTVTPILEKIDGVLFILNCLLLSGVCRSAYLSTLCRLSNFLGRNATGVLPPRTAIPADRGCPTSLHRPLQWTSGGEERRHPAVCCLLWADIAWWPIPCPNVECVQFECAQQ